MVGSGGVRVKKGEGVKRKRGNKRLIVVEEGMRGLLLFFFKQKAAYEI